jgi:hypothetical protein
MPTKEVGNQKQPFFKKFWDDAKLLTTNAKRKAPQQPVAASGNESHAAAKRSKAVNRLRA